jgi:hypothetical protein
MTKFVALASMLPPAATRKIGELSLKLSERSPEILLAVGIGGFVATTVLASRAALKVDDALDKANEDIARAQALFDDKEFQAERGVEYSAQDFLQDRVTVRTRIVLSFAKHYAPVVVVGALSIYCLTKSHSILKDRNTALIAAYTAIHKSYEAYRERVRNEIGVESERDLYFDARYETVEREVVGEDGEKKTSKEVQKKVGPYAYSPYARFFDETNVNWERTAEYNYLFLRAKQAYANDVLRSRGHLFLNEVYEQLGIPHSREGAVVAWILTEDGSTDNFVDFGFMSGEFQRQRDFVNGSEGSILLDFNVDGVIVDRIPESDNTPYAVWRRAR